MALATPADVARTAQIAAAAQPAWARPRTPNGIVHINEQTVDDKPNIPFGGIGASGTGARFGGAANLDAFTDTRWATVRGDIAPYPF
jgi:benzaldehyde dehydrogenase (NAD)